MKLIQVTALGVLLVGCGANVVFGSDDGNGGEAAGANGSGAGQSSGAGTNTGASSADGGAGAAAPDTTVSTGGSTSTGPTLEPIPCGDTSCDPVSQDCCFDFNDASCIAHGDFCQGALLSCAGTANCDPGLVCCAHFGMGGPPRRRASPIAPVDLRAAARSSASPTRSACTGTASKGRADSRFVRAAGWAVAGATSPPDVRSRATLFVATGSGGGDSARSLPGGS